MKRKQRRSQAPGFCLDRATIPSSLQARQAALWAIRMAQGKVRNDFLTQNPERFIGITAPHLKWCESSFKRFFFYYDGSDEEREALEQLSPKKPGSSCRPSATTTPNKPSRPFVNLKRRR